MKQRSSLFIRLLKIILTFAQAGVLIWSVIVVVRDYSVRNTVAATNGSQVDAISTSSEDSTPSPAPISDQIQAFAGSQIENLPPISSPIETPAAVPTQNSILALPTSNAWVLCSPMKGVAISRLNSIISDGYHPPPKGTDGRHWGVDFAFFSSDTGRPIEGNDIDAILPGVVASVIFDRPPFGNMVMIETRYKDVSPEEAQWLNITESQSLYHLYAHMRSPAAVDPEYLVSCGQFLGKVGETGDSTNPHLHLETRLGPPASSFPVMAYDITASPVIGVTEEEKKNYTLWRMGDTFNAFDPMTIFTNYLSFVQ